MARRKSAQNNGTQTVRKSPVTMTESPRIDRIDRIARDDGHYRGAAQRGRNRWRYQRSDCSP
jgi:hypothetical protein